MDILSKVSVTSGEKLAGFDVLTGESCRVSRSFTQPGAFGTGYGGRRVLHQTGELLYRALLHTHSPFPGQERQEITGGQYLVTRNQDDIVTGFHRLHDGKTSVPVTLMTGNGALPASKGRTAARKRPVPPPPRRSRLSGTIKKGGRLPDQPPGSQPPLLAIFQ